MQVWLIFEVKWNPNIIFNFRSLPILEILSGSIAITSQMALGPVHLTRRRHLKTGSFVSTVRSTVHTNPSRKPSFSKTLFKPEENAGFSFSCGRKIFWKQSFSKTIASPYSCDFPDRVFLKHKSKITSDCYVFKFLRRSVDGKHWKTFWEWNLRFQISPHFHSPRKTPRNARGR